MAMRLQLLGRWVTAACGAPRGKSVGDDVTKCSFYPYAMRDQVSIEKEIERCYMGPIGVTH
jgi:hypothetical protein